MIVGPLDLGPNNPFKKTRTGLHTSVVEIPGGYAIPYAVDSTHPAWSAAIWVQAQSTVGQYAAKTLAATESLCRQLEELVRNYDQQPVYVQFFAGTGVVALSPAFQQPQDGWYYISGLDVDYSRSLQSFCPITLNLEYVSPGVPRRSATSFTGGGLSSTFSGAATSWVAIPFGATNLLGSLTRTGSEGAIPWIQSPAVNPSPYVPSSTIANWYLGGCRVYDVMAAIGSNAVPVDGTATNTNWIEALGADHRFVGDVILSNGLILLTLSTGASPGIVGYLWNTNKAPAQWQSFASLFYQDSGANNATVRQISLRRVGLEEVACDVLVSTGGNKTALLTLRLQRGSYGARVDLRPQAEANSVNNGLFLRAPSSPKILYTSGIGATVSTVDNVLAAQTATSPTTDYGYGAAIIANSTYSFLSGWLYQNPPGSQQPAYNNSTDVGIGDNSGPGQNSTRSYGVFAVPFATPQNLQGEAESGTLGTGWSSVADANQSAGNVAKCASGTLTGNADTWGTAWVPAVGQYDVRMLVKVTSAAGSASEMKLGLYNSTDSTFVASTTYKANQVTTSYAWYTVASGVTPTATKNMRFRAETTATLGTDWFIDEAVLVPTTSTSSYNFPQDIAQQFLYEATRKPVLG